MENQVNNQKGQTLLEFVLLTAMAVTVSTLLMRITNQGLGIVWERAVNMVVWPSRVTLR